MQIVMSQSEFSKPDYAALVKAVSHSSPTPEDWLAVGQQIYSPTYGFGQVIGVLGSRLVVDSLEVSLECVFLQLAERGGN